MEKKHIFTGAATAIVTPMNDSGVDYEALGKLIDWQIASGISAIVVCATTGEAPTLTDNEHCKVLEFAIRRADRKIPIIAGTGSNDTGHAIMMTQYACAIGASAVLCVTPYYNRPTQTGLIASYTAIADASSEPVDERDSSSRTRLSFVTFERMSERREHSSPSLPLSTVSSSEVGKWQKTLSQTDISKLSAQTGRPSDAMTTACPTAQVKTDLPPRLGPVTI